MGTTFYKFIIFLVFMCNNFYNTYAQSIQLDTSLLDVYHFDIRKESDEGFLTSYYQAVNTLDSSRPFEIIVTQTSSKLMDIKGVVDGIEKNLKYYNPESQLILLKKGKNENSDRRLYQFADKNTTILMLMQEINDTFVTIEAEFPDEELKRVSIQKWQDIFWKAK